MGGSLRVDSVVYPPSDAFIPSYIGDFPTKDTRDDFAIETGLKRMPSMVDPVAQRKGKFRVFIRQDAADRMASNFFNSELGTPGAIRYTTVPGELPANVGPGNN